MKDRLWLLFVMLAKILCVLRIEVNFMDLLGLLQITLLVKERRKTGKRMLAACYTTFLLRNS